MSDNIIRFKYPPCLPCQPPVPSLNRSYDCRRRNTHYRKHHSKYLCRGECLKTTKQILESVVFKEYHSWMHSSCRAMTIEEDPRKLAFYYKLLPFLKSKEKYYHSFVRIRSLVWRKKHLYE